jgi:type II secretory pathway pseudopilin PulG
MRTKLHHADGRRNIRRVAAFTMVEIALALAVIAFALVAIIGVLPAGMSVQRDNRESTLINFDANYLLNAITSGSIGTDDLTNHIISITNIVTPCNALGVPLPSKVRTIAYTTNGTFINTAKVGPNYLTNGLNIVSLLSTPKYLPFYGGGGYYSNFITADFRGITGSLADYGTSQAARDFAFTYRVYPEIIPYQAADASPWANNPDAGIVAHNFQGNFTQVRLRFRWPILPTGQAGTSRLTFRTAASGELVYLVGLPPDTNTWPVPTALIQQGTYVGYSQ